MLAIFWTAALCLTALNVHASTRWCDSVTDICFQQNYFSGQDASWSYLFPPAGQSTDEFIGMYTAPLKAGWIAAGLGGGMTSSLLVIGWMDGSKPILSTRHTSTITAPALYRGPTLTALGTSGVNSTHQRILYRCQNCTSWTSGSIPSTSTVTFGWAIQNSYAPENPSDPDSTIYQHTVASRHDVDIDGARSDSYQAYLEQLLGGPAPTTTTQIDPTTTTTSTSTTSTTTTSTTTSTAPGPTQTPYGQCGGNGYTGPTDCGTGYVCNNVNEWYSQCIPG